MKKLILALMFVFSVQANSGVVVGIGGLGLFMAGSYGENFPVAMIGAAGLTAAVGLLYWGSKVPNGIGQYLLTFLNEDIEPLKVEIINKFPFLENTVLLEDITDEIFNISKDYQYSNKNKIEKLKLSTSIFEQSVEFNDFTKNQRILLLNYFSPELN